jgi:hypothetical protein
MLRGLWFTSGLCAGITVTSKLVFAPLFVVFWVLASYHVFSTQRPRFAAILKNLWAPVGLGVATILAIVGVKLWTDGALDELLWTAFVYPPEALSTSPNAPYIRLSESLRFFLTFYMAWSGFIFIAIFQWRRSERDLFTSLLIAWLWALD